MPKKAAPDRVLVLVNAVPPGHSTKRRTVRPKMGAPYQLEFAPGVPVVLIGDDEIAAVESELACREMKSVELAPEQAQHLLADLADKAAADEITRLRRRVAQLETRLESVEVAV